jgi:hypothetical protein
VGGSTCEGYSIYETSFYGLSVECRLLLMCWKPKKELIIHLITFTVGNGRKKPGKINY